MPWIETQKILVFKRALDQKTEAITNNLRAPFLKGYECLRLGIRKTKIETTSLYSEMGLPGIRACYPLNLFNIGAIDFDKNTSHYSYILSAAAKELGCAINTGGLGLTSGFLRGGADLIWRIREEDYKEYENMADVFENQMFLNTVSRSYIKMIEIQTSGKSFLNGKNKLDLSETIFLIQKLRLVSKGKPVGICLRPSAIDEINPITGNTWLREADPDFITIEEDVNHPEHGNLKLLIEREEGLLKSVKAAREAIKRYRLRTKIIASGKFVSEFELLRMLAFGADSCITRTPFEWLLNGKLNAPISCSTNARSLIKNFHRHTLEATAGIMGECGFHEINHISADFFLKRVNYTRVKNLKEVYR